MANSWMVGNAPQGASYAGNPNFGMQLGQIISQYPNDYMTGRQNRRTIQAEDAFKDPKDWQNEDGSPNVNKVFAKGMELGGLPYATQLLGFMQKQPIYNKILRENDEGGYDDQGGQQSPATQPPARPNNGTAGPGNLAPPPPRLIPVQPRLSSAGTDNQGPQTINSLASEVFGERDVTDLLPRYAAAVRNKLGEPLTPEQEQTARALMTRTAGSQGWSQAPRQSSADIMPPSGPDSAVERGMNGPGGTGGIAQNGPVTVGQLAGYPAFCIGGTKADGRLVWFDFWGVAPIGDDEADYAFGGFCGEEAVKHARDHEGCKFIEAVLTFMANHLCDEERCASRLEFGFVDRVRMDYPDVIERVIARWLKGALTGTNLRIRGGEADAIAHHNGDSRY
jgi:hypothetical protein